MKRQPMGDFRLMDTRELVDCAMGRKPAHVLIKNGQWVSVQTGEIIPGTDIAIVDQRIAYVGPDGNHTRGEYTQVIDAAGWFIVPGLLDAHMHVESGMVTVTEFVRAVSVRGTTGLFIDPHEIANVFGLRGVRLMLDEAAAQPIHVFVQMPSCVPSAPGLETPGASIGPAEVAEAMVWPGIIGLGEMMNYPGVVANDPSLHAEMGETWKAGKLVGGHYASPDLGIRFHAYAAGGADDDHEGTTMEDAIARSRQGMKVMMRYGSGWHDVAEQVRAITEKGLDSRHFLLCTDDSHSETLLTDGHMDRVVRHTISLGVDPVMAIQMATLNTAEHFGMSDEIGMIAPGRYADILLVENLENFSADLVLAKGELIAEHGNLKIELPKVDYPDWALDSMHLPDLRSEDFRIKTEKRGEVVVNVIGIIENQAPTRHLKTKMQVLNGEINLDPQQDLAKVALIERHNHSSRVQLGLVQGFGFTANCAVASTIVHDSHQMIIVGTDDGNMLIAAKKLAEAGGGQIVVKDGEVIGMVELRIGGLLSTEPAGSVAQKARTVLDGFKACGCNLNNPNMQLSLLGLVVIPELRISDLGLVDVNQFKVIPLIE